MNILASSWIHYLLLIFFCTISVFIFRKRTFTRANIFLGIIFLFYSIFTILDLYTILYVEQSSQQFHNFKISCLGGASFALYSFLLNIFDRATSENILRRKRRIETRLPLLGVLTSWLVVQRFGNYVFMYVIILSLLALIFIFFNTKIGKIKITIAVLFLSSILFYGISYLKFQYIYFAVNIFTPLLLISTTVIGILIMLNKKETIDEAC